MMLHALMKAWAGELGGGPRERSTLEVDRRASASFVTDRMPDPFGQSWAFAQTLGNVATNHEAVLRESLLGFANGQTSKPITVVTTMARVVLETLALQVWLIDPLVSTPDRFARWTALEYQSELASWRIVRPDASRLDNPVASQLLRDARALGLDVDGKSSPDWIGTQVPTSTALAGLLAQRYATHAGRGTTNIASVGETFYRLFSGEIHGSVGSVLSLLLPTTDTVGPSGRRVHAYDLSHGALWNAMGLVLISTFAARCTYAEWLGIPVDPEARRLHIHHVELAVRKVSDGP